MSRRSSYFLFILLLACTGAWAQSGPGFSSLEERMTQREFEETGLHKLSSEELAALNRWIRQRSLATIPLEERDPAPSTISSPPGQDQAAAGLPSQPREVTPLERMAREPFQTRILGRFNGSDGSARFRLENGMVWEQIDGEAFYVPEVENPVVTIKPAALGSWRLTVEGSNRAVRVRRVH